MLTVVVAFQNIQWFDNYHLLRKSFTTTTKDGQTLRVIVHDNPVRAMAGETVSKNYDILIDCHPNGMTHLVEKDYIPIPRLPKSKQMQVLDNIYQRAGLKSVIQPKTWEVDIPTSSVAGPVDVRQAVVKPDNGARGIFQCSFAPSLVSERAILKAYHKAGSYEELMVLLGELTTLHHNDRIRQEDMDNMRGILDGGLIIQEQVQDIVCEKRVLFRREPDTGNFVLRIQDREINEDATLPQCTGSKGRPCDLKPLWGGPEKDFLDEILPLLNQPFGALDLFQVDVKALPHFGIFEFQGQYGTEGVGCEAAAFFETWIAEEAEYFLKHGRVYEAD